MASKIIVDQLESSGSNITIPTGTGLVVTDGIAATNLSGTIADARLPTVPVTKGGTGLTSLGSAGQSIKVNSGGNALEFGTISAGITEADMYRLHATQSSSSETILTNWERVDDASYGKIGTGLSVSSGIFTFGATGLYHLIFNAETAHEGGTGYVHLYLRGSTDNFSSNDDLARSNNYHDGGHVGYSSIGAFFNCTNTSTHKVACYFNTSFSNAGVNGATDNTRTSLSAVRLGDSV